MPRAITDISAIALGNIVVSINAYSLLAFFGGAGGADAAWAP